MKAAAPGAPRRGRGPQASPHPPGPARRRVPVASAAAIALAAAAIGSGCNPAAEISAPVIALNDVEVRGFSGGVAQLYLWFDIVNQNGFEITLVRIKGSLTLDDRDVGEASWSGEIDCTPRDTTSVHIPVRLAVGAADDLFRALIDRQPMRHRLRGEATIARGVIQRTYAVDAATAGSKGR